MSNYFDRRLRIPRLAVTRTLLFMFLTVMASTTVARIIRAQEASSTSDPPRIEHLWYGAMMAGGREFRFAIEVKRDAQGTESHELLSLDEGQRRFALDEFQLVDHRLEFSLKSTNATYSGELAEDGTRAAGKWKQGGREFDLSLRKVREIPADIPDELWIGTLDAVVQKLEIRFRVYREKTTDGNILSTRVRMDSATQRAGGFIAELSIEDGTWRVKVPAVQGSFAGPWTEGAKEIRGTWQQAGSALDLTLTKSDPSQAATAPPKLARPQTPVTPFPYEVEFVKFENTIDGVTLSGTLTLPRTAEKCPVAVLISGSGPQDRDETLFEHRPFLVIADYLTRRGIGVLRFDDRGVGASTGKFELATSEDFARDVEAGVDFLRRHPGIDSSKIGLIGHSEGGLIAPMVAVHRQDIAWIVLLAGTGVNGEQILLSQGELVLRAEGKTEHDELQAQRHIQTTLFEVVRDSEADESNEQLVQRSMERLKTRIAADADEKLQRAVESGVKQLRTPWFRFFLSHEPSAVLRHVKCPVLALNGDKDVQVDPELNLPAIEQAVRSGGNQDITIQKLPNLNHLFQTTTTGAVSEYSQLEETFALSALEAIAGWIGQQSSQ